MCFKLFKQHIKYSEIFHVGFVVVCYTAVFVFSIIITMFLKFHIKLVLTNSTTIESLDTEHKKDNEKFNLGYKQNWEQVFGVEPLLWFFPIPTKRGRPEGDGLTWKTNEPGVSDSNIKGSDINNKNYASNDNYKTNFNSNAPFSPGTQ